MHKFIALFSCFILGICLIVSLSLFGVIELNSKKYAYVNVEELIEKIHSQIIVRKLSEAENNILIEKAKLLFYDELNNYAATNNAVVFSSHKVIAGAENITNLLIFNIIGKL